MNIRPADVNDIAWMVAELCEFSKWQNNKRGLFSSPEFARGGLTNLVLNHFVRIAHRGPERAGFIVGVLVPHPFNPSIKVLSENFWWVAEKHRHTRAGLMLLNSFVDWGKTNADWITMGLETNSPVNDRALLRRGFRLAEKSFLLEVR